MAADPVTAYQDQLTSRVRGKTLLDTAKTYLPAEDNVQRAITNGAQAAKAYLPSSIAGYLASSSDSELPPPRPPFASEGMGGSALTNLSTEAQAGSLDSASTVSAAQNPIDASLGNLSTTVHTGTAASLHPVAPSDPVAPTPPPAPFDTPPVPALPTPLTHDPAILAPKRNSKFIEGFPTPPTPAALTESPAPLSSAFSTDFVPAAVSSSEQSEGVPVPPNSKATTRDDDEVAPAAAQPHTPTPAPAAAALHAPPTPDGSDSDSAAEDAGTGTASSPSGKKKPKLVQRLKEKLHAGHSREHS
ncbi:hypothetical protein B0H14DRAFT_3656738 [Mycena olivaceomarginata]|nr:hypothetical protein B0H14DRAFT_3656738 [Mycena olivaceomarginata]